MGSIERFEDLVAWQRARTLTNRVYDLTRTSRLASDRDLSRQLQRAAVSIMSNIAEGYERGSLKEYHQFLVMAKASCAEVRSQLYVALDVGYLDQADFTEMMQLTVETSKIIGGLRASIARKLDSKS
jgi:four helix bundle protein